jgi:hypothetical protein
MQIEPINQIMMRPRPYAHRVGLPPRTLYHYLSTGSIPSYRFKGVLLIDIAEADAVIRSGLQRVDSGLTKVANAKAKGAK